MSQQINLLKQYRAGPSAAVVALLIVIVTALALGAAWGVKHRMLEAVRAAEKVSAAELKRVSDQLEGRLQSRSEQMAAELAALKPRAQAAEQILLLATGLGKTDGYFSFFSILARVREDGVWLTEAAVSKAGKSLKLGGQSLDKDALSRYVQRMNTAFADSGIQFTAFEMTAEPFGAVGTGAQGGSLSLSKFTIY